MKKKEQDSDTIPEVLEGKDHADIEGLLKKSIKWSEAVYEQNKKIQRQLRWMSIAGYIRLGIILIPLIIGLIYLPPLLAGVWSQYQSILGISPNVGLDTGTVKSLLDQISTRTNGIDIDSVLGTLSGN